MTRTDHLIAWVVSLIGSLIAFGGVRFFESTNVSIALFTGTLLGSITAAWRYHQRDTTPAPLVRQLELAGGLAIASLVMGLLIQQVWRPMDNPPTTLLISALGTVVLTLLAFRHVQRTLDKS